MEEKKFDLNSLIGFVLLGAIMIYYFYTNQPTQEELAQQKMEQVQDSIDKLTPVAEQSDAVCEKVEQAPINPSDSRADAQAQNS